MKGIKTVVSAAVACLFLGALAQNPSGGRPVPAPRDGVQTEEPAGRRAAPGGEGKTIVDIKAKKVFPIKIGDSTCFAYVGGVVAYHNGAVMLCDSAIRYDENNMECFRNVLINKDSTYVYGDRVFYDRRTSLAEVFSPLIKMIDGQAVLYTYHFSYNTATNIGEFWGGGSLRQEGMLLESERGYYFGNTRDAVCVGDAQLRDSTYQIRSDSIGYNMDSNVATFYLKTFIWNDKGEILSADQGWYDTSAEHYRFMSDAYVMTADQEIWADDIDFYSQTEDAVLQRNVQILDRENEVLAFGDYGRYWGDRGDAMLTRRPSVISYSEGSDSLFMRADSIFMYVIDSTSVYSADYIGNRHMDQSAEDSEEELVVPGADVPGPALPGAGDSAVGSVQVPAEEDRPGAEAGADEEAPELVSNAVGRSDMPEKPEVPETSEAPEAADDLRATESPEAVKSTESPEAAEVPELAGQEAASADTPQAESVSGPADDNAGQKMLTAREKRRMEREARRQNKEQSRAARADTTAVADSAESAEPVPAINAETGTDATAEEMAGTVPAPVEKSAVEPAAEENGGEPEAVAAPAAAATEDAAAGAESEEAVQDDDEEVERVVVGYHDVRIYRRDMQAVCDSLVAFSRDTTVHLHTDPVMWNGDNQIKSDLAVVYLKDEMLDHAVFTGGEVHGNPVMSSEIDTAHYNQITGKQITALFRDNEVSQTDVDGNGQAYYYMQDEQTHDLQGFMVIECSSITFRIVDGDLDEVVFRGSPDWDIYPMEMIPASQPQRLDNFVWEADRRPDKEDVFDRTIRPSQRADYEEMPRPRFPMTARIDRYRNTIVERGIWRDRDDDVTFDAIEFMRLIDSRRTPGAQSGGPAAPVRSDTVGMQGATPAGRRASSDTTAM